MQDQQNFIRKVILFFIIVFLFRLFASNPLSIVILLFILYIVYKFIKNKSPASNIFDIFRQSGTGHKTSSENWQGRAYNADSPESKIKNMMDQYKKMALAFLAFIILVLLATQMILVIPAGETGVYHLFGKVRDEEISSGLHVINPFAKITRMSIRTEEYTMSGIQEEGKVKGDDSIKTLTKEGLNVGLDLTVLYHLEEDKASDVYKDIGVEFDRKIIRPEIRANIREIAATYNAVDIYTEKRTELIEKIQNKLIKVINPRGLTIETVLLRNVTLPAGLTKSIEEKLQADQEAQRMDFVLNREKKEAERIRIQAAGQRDAQKIINESLTDNYLNYLYINELNNRPGTIYVPMSPSSGMPMFKNIQ